MELRDKTFTPEELAEVFPSCPIREVDFEVRFTPRFRIQSEMWRFQESIVGDYPEVSVEQALSPNGAKLDVTVFRNEVAARLVKVSIQNLALAFSSYTKFEDFKDEVVSKAQTFASLYSIDSFTRVGLRYVNEITLPTQEPESLTRYVKPLLAFERFPLNTIQQFAMQISAVFDKHMATIRSALIAGPIRTYVLDIDAHTGVITHLDKVGSLLDDFHDSAQRIFLDSITDEYKAVMRGSR
jgi:uncharacterized protein (TIGR04255 family)